MDPRHTVEGLQSVNKLTSSAFALCVLLGATTPSSAEETVCRRYDAEHENNLIAYNGCMQEQRIARLKVATWIERVDRYQGCVVRMGMQRVPCFFVFQSYPPGLRWDPLH